MVKFKIISIICYAFILLAGQMIKLPLFLWLLFTSFEFNNPDQLYAILGLIGLLLYIREENNSALKIILILLLILSPLIKRIIFIPIKMFNYPEFYIPLIAFVVFYVTTMIGKGNHFSRNIN